MAASSESPRLQSLSKMGLWLVAIALFLTLLGAWIASSQSIATIDQIKFENYTENLQSYAHEGLFISQQYEHERSLANYTTVSSEKLYEAVSDLNMQLQTETPEPDLKQKVATRAQQASDLADVLSHLSKSAAEGQQTNVTANLQQIVNSLAKT